MKMGFPEKKEDKRVFENRAPRNVFGKQRKEVAGVW
jgi:hypothetical protein